MEQNSLENTTKDSGRDAVIKILVSTKSTWALNYWFGVLSKLDKSVP